MSEQVGQAAPAGTSSADTRSRASRLPLGWIALALLVTAAAVLRPQQLWTTLQSPSALALIVGVVVLTVLLGRIGRHLPFPVGSVLAATPTVLAVALLVVPTLRTTTVDEDLTGLLPAAPAGAMTDPGDAPVRLATAAVEGIGHRADGSASLVRLADGALVVRFEELMVDPGPDYRVHLVPGSGHTSPGTGTELAALKASAGNQNYSTEGLPAELPLTVLIWCEAFSVPIAAATLQ